MFKNLVHDYVNTWVSIMASIIAMIVIAVFTPVVPIALGRIIISLPKKIKPVRYALLLLKVI